MAASPTGRSLTRASINTERSIGILYEFRSDYKSTAHSARAQRTSRWQLDDGRRWGALQWGVRGRLKTSLSGCPPETLRMRGGRGGFASGSRDGSEGFGLRLYQGLYIASGRHNMKIALTTKQIGQLTTFFDRVRATASLGKPGMLVAQIRWEQTGDGRYWMEPAFLPNEVAQCIVEKGQGEVVLRAQSPTVPADSRAPQSARTARDAPTDMPENVALARQ